MRYRIVTRKNAPVAKGDREAIIDKWYELTDRKPSKRFKIVDNEFKLVNIEDLVVEESKFIESEPEPEPLPENDDITWPWEKVGGEPEPKPEPEETEEKDSED